MLIVNGFASRNVPDEMFYGATLISKKKTSMRSSFRAI